MGWTNSHLHQFIIHGQSYGIPAPEFEGEIDEIIDGKTVQVDKLLPFEKTKFLYEYDFGDGWEHEVVLEKILPVKEGVEYPICIKGKRACPPEDCGSYPGYERICELMENPNDSEYEEMLEWLGKKYDPEEFDIDETNEAIKNPVDIMGDFLE